MVGVDHRNLDLELTQASQDVPIIRSSEDDTLPPAPKRMKSVQPQVESAKRQLPPRINKSQHPGLPDVPRPKRSHEEVQKQRDRLEALKVQEKMLQDERREELAKLEILEREAAEAEEQSIVCMWADEEPMVVDNEHESVTTKSKKVRTWDLTAGNPHQQIHLAPAW